MNCPYCNHSVPDESVFCMICGERIARKKREKKPPAKYPKYRVLADGSLLGQLMVAGTRETIKAENEKQYKAKIDALRTGIAEMKHHPDGSTSTRTTAFSRPLPSVDMRPYTGIGSRTTWASRSEKSTSRRC